MKGKKLKKMASKGLSVKYRNKKNLPVFIKLDLTTTGAEDLEKLSKVRISYMARYYGAQKLAKILKQIDMYWEAEHKNIFLSTIGMFLYEELEHLCRSWESVNPEDFEKIDTLTFEVGRAAVTKLLLQEKENKKKKAKEVRLQKLKDEQNVKYNKN